MMYAPQFLVGQTATRRYGFRCTRVWSLTHNSRALVQRRPISMKQMNRDTLSSVWGMFDNKQFRSISPLFPPHPTLLPI